jgi:2-hydroxy-3-keto-5-methylthiopentenyl-1-phosphate phosphatase
MIWSSTLVSIGLNECVDIIMSRIPLFSGINNFQVKANHGSLPIMIVSSESGPIKFETRLLPYLKSIHNDQI